MNSRKAGIGAAHAIMITEITLKTALKLFPTQSRLLTTPKKEPFDNSVGKGENAGNQHFLLFLQYYLPIPKRMPVVKLHFLLSANDFNLDQSKILSFGKELNIIQSMNQAESNSKTTTMMESVCKR